VKLFRTVIFLFITLLLNTYNTFCQNKENSDTDKAKSGVMDFNLYYDTRNFNVMTINLSAQITEELRYFSLNTFYDNSADKTTNTYYSEHNLRLNAFTDLPIDLTFQTVTSSGIRSLVSRLGVMWHLDKTKYLDQLFNFFNLRYNTTYHLFQISQNKHPELFTQIEHVYALRPLPDLLDNRVYISGFADQNIIYEDDGKITFHWVNETQLGVRLVKELYFVVEYRLNKKLPKKEGVGIGLEYMIKL